MSPQPDDRHDAPDPAGETRAAEDRLRAILADLVPDSEQVLRRAFARALPVIQPGARER